MEKLELKHLAPYLPYGLYWFCLDKDSREFETLGLSKIDLANEEVEIGGMDIELSELPYPNGLVIKPILRPLSDLTKEIEHNGEKFVPIDWLNENKSVSLLIGIRPNTGEETVFNKRTNSSNIRFFEHCIIEKLFEWHFDVFGLIDKGLAIDINTLNQ